MRKLHKVVNVCFFFFLYTTLVPSAYAIHITLPITQNPNPAYSNSDTVTLTFTNSDNDFDTATTSKYSLRINNGPVFTQHTPDNATLIIPIKLNALKKTAGQDIQGYWQYNVWKGSFPSQFTDANFVYSGQFYIQPPEAIGGTGLLSLKMDNNTFLKNTPANLYIENAQPNQVYTVWFDKDSSPGFLFSGEIANFTTFIERDGFNTGVVQINVGNSATSSKKICLTQGGTKFNGSFLLTCNPSLDILVTDTAPVSPPTPIRSNNSGVPANPPTPTVTGPPPSPPLPPCNKFVDTRTEQEVNPSQAPNTPYKCAEVDSALGHIATDPAPFIKSIFTILLSMAGGWAVVFIILAAYQLLMSRGDAEGTKEAREKITSAIVGVVFIILSIVILQVIGVDVFKLPTFQR